MKLKWHHVHLSNEDEIKELIAFLSFRERNGLPLFGVEIRFHAHSTMEIRLPKSVYPKFRQQLVKYAGSKFDIFKEVGLQ